MQANVYNLLNRFYIDQPHPEPFDSGRGTERADWGQLPLLIRQERTMLITIEKVLTPEQVKVARVKLATAQWTDGRVTAGYQAQEVKRNAQIPEGSPSHKELGDMVLAGSRARRASCRRRFHCACFRRCSTATPAARRFGTHVDTAIRQLATTGQRIRTDLSATLFLTAPEEYDGGELIVEDNYGEKSVKLPAGDMVLYPATSLHRVEPVTRGNRMSSFFWIQSMVRQDAQRTLLFDLDETIQRLAGSGARRA